MAMAKIESGNSQFFLINGLPKQRGEYELVTDTDGATELLGIRMVGRDGWVIDCELQPVTNYTDNTNASIPTLSAFFNYVTPFMFFEGGSGGSPIPNPAGNWQSARLATTTNITLTGLQTIDGVPLNSGDRVVVWQQGVQSQNGIYVASSGTWARAADASILTDFVLGKEINVLAGATNQGAIFINNSPEPVTVGSTSIQFLKSSSDFPRVSQSPVLLGRYTAGAGRVEEVLLGTGFAFAGSTLNFNGILQGGNSFGAAVRIGSNDLFDLELETNNTVRQTIASDGRIGVGVAPVLNTAFAIQGVGATSGTSSFLVLNGSGAEIIRARNNRTILIADDTGRALETFTGGRVDFGSGRLIQLFGGTGQSLFQNVSGNLTVQIIPNNAVVRISATGQGHVDFTIDGGNGNGAFRNDSNQRYVTYVRATTQTVFGEVTAATTPRAQVEIISTTRGFLPPKMTTAQRDAVAWAAIDAGMVIYNITTAKLQSWNGTTWNDLF